MDAKTITTLYVLIVGMVYWQKCDEECLGQIIEIDESRVHTIGFLRLLVWDGLESC